MKNRLIVGSVLILLGGFCNVDAVKKSKIPSDPKERIKIFEMQTENEQEVNSLLNEAPYKNLSPEEKAVILERNRAYWKSKSDTLESYEKKFQDQIQKEDANIPVLRGSIVMPEEHTYSDHKVKFDSKFPGYSGVARRDAENLMKNMNDSESEMFRDREKTTYQITPLGPGILYLTPLFDGSLCINIPTYAGAGTEQKVIVDICKSGSLNKFNAICEDVIADEDNQLFKEIESLVLDNPDVKAASGQNDYRKVVVNVFKEIILATTAKLVAELDIGRSNFTGTPQAIKKELEAMQKKPTGLSIKDRLKMLQGGH